MKPSIKSLKPSIKLPFAEEQINKKIKENIKKQVEKEINKIFREIDKRTIIYFVLSIAGLFLIFAPLPSFVFYSLFFVIMLVVFYLLTGIIKSVKKFSGFINNFDTTIETVVKNKIEKEKKESLKNRIGFQLSGHDNESIANLLISYSIKELVYKFKEKKKSIVTRIAAYTIIVLLFKEVFTKILY